MQVFIRTIDDKILTFEMEHSNKIRDVRMKIQEKTKFSTHQQNLFYQGEILNDDERTIDEYGIYEKSVIDADCKFRCEIQIFDRIWDGHPIEFRVRTDKINNIKYKIQNKKVLHSKKQKNVYQDVILDDDKTRDEYQVIDNVAKLGEIQIFAKTMDGKTFPIVIRKLNKIIDIKYKIQEKLGWHPDEQKLIYQGAMLDDERTIDECQICDGSMINVVVRLRGGIQIFAKTMDGKTVAFEVDKLERIREIKKKIQEKLGLHPDEQRLIYQGAMLDDERTIDECQICEKSVINVVARWRYGMRIFAKTMDGKSIELEVFKSDRIRDMKKKIQEKLGLHPDEQKLVYQGGILEDDKAICEYGICEKFVINVVQRLRGGIQIFAKTMERKIVLIEVFKSERIINIKKKIQQKTGLYKDEQILVFQGRMLDDDDKTVDEYEICDQSVINVVARLRNKIQIFAKTMDGKTVAFKVDKSYKIIDVKYKIRELIGLHQEEQILIYQDGLLNDDWRTIDEYQICDESVINIIDKYHIFILAKPLEGINNAIIVHKSFRIIDIKYKIQDKIGLHPYEQILYYQGELLDDDERTLKEYKIDEKSVIDIVVKIINGMQLFVQTMDGSKAIIYVQKSDKIRNVKVKIQEKLGLYPNEQKLVYLDKILDDYATIGEYQIYEKAVIEVGYHTRFFSLIIDIMKTPVNYGIKLFAKIVEGKIISIFIGKKDKIKNIMWQIHFQTGLHPDVQKLFYKGVVLEDEKMVDDYQISAHSTLEVVKMMEVFVKTLNGKIFSIYLLNTDSIRDVKCRIQEKTGLSRDEQILFYQNKSLNDDSKTVNQYQIREIAVINILVRLKNEIQIFVQISEQSIIPINILKTAKIIDVKSKFAEKTGMQCDDNKLVYRNRSLDNERLLIDYQIGDGCVISVENSQLFLFIQAIKSGSLETVQDLYDNKFHKMKNEQISPMHYACKQDNADILTFLIKSNFKINTVDQEYNMPIHYACINGCVKILETLIQYKCKIEAYDAHGMKPIHLACLNGNYQNVKLLIEHGCDLESKDYLGRRPIHLACLVGNIDIVKLLIENKCKINVVDKSNKSPFSIAEKENLTKIMEIIEEGISRRMINIMITELSLKCPEDCDHNFCQTSLRNKTFNKGNRINKNNAGNVYRCKLSQSIREIAIKKIPKDSIQSKYIEGNINRFIKKVNHERLIKYFGAITKEKNIFIFMEFMSKGSLRSQISKNPPMNSIKVIHYTIQILEGLQFLHSMKIIHRDIKPDNILLDDDGNVKLADFGLGLLLCKTDGQTKPAKSFCGTAYYMAPEIINGGGYSYGADIWALGVTVIEMATGICPFQELVPEAAIFKIATSKTFPYQLPTSFPKKIQDLLDRILIHVPARRISATNLLNILKKMK